MQLCSCWCFTTTPHVACWAPYATVQPLSHATALSNSEGRHVNSFGKHDFKGLVLSHIFSIFANGSFKTMIFFSDLSWFSVPSPLDLPRLLHLSQPRQIPGSAVIFYSQGKAMSYRRQITSQQHSACPTRRGTGGGVLPSSVIMIHEFHDWLTLQHWSIGIKSMGGSQSTPLRSILSRSDEEGSLHATSSINGLLMNDSMRKSCQFTPSERLAGHL